MVTPISNDKILPSDSSGSSVTEKKKTERQATTQTTPRNDIIANDEKVTETSSVDVERANQIYNSSAAKISSAEDTITNAEQAKAIAAEIRTQIEGNALEALKAHSGTNPGGLAALLEAAPV